MRFHYLILYREPGYSDWRWLSTIKFRNSRTKEVAKFTANGSVIKSYFSRKVAEQVRAGLVEFERKRLQGIIDRCKSSERQEVAFLDFTLAEYEALLEGVDSFFAILEEEWRG